MKLIDLAISALVGLALYALPLSAFAVQCDVPNALSTKISQEFFQKVRQDYPGSMSNGHTQSISMGHALGRVASAVQGDPQREMAFACLDKSMEQLAIQMNLKGLPDFNYRLLQEAARGFHDNTVYNLTGVKNTSPYYDFMDRVVGPLGSTSGASSNSGHGANASNAQTARNIFGVNPPSNSSTQSGNSLPERFRDPANTIVSQGTYRNTYTAKECSNYANFSLDQANNHLSTATDLMKNFNARHGQSGDCTGDNWMECRNILNAVDAGRDQIYQVFSGNLGINYCLNCDLGAAHRYARDVKTMENWLVKRGFSTAWGIGTIQETIGGYLDNPTCSDTTPSYSDTGDYYGSLSIPSVPSANAGSGNNDSVEGWGVDGGAVEKDVTQANASIMHPCKAVMDNHGLATARWNQSSRMGVGRSYYEAAGRYICLTNGFVELKGNSFVTTVCDSDHATNCRSATRSPITGNVTETKRNDNGTTTYYYGSNNFNTRITRVPE